MQLGLVDVASLLQFKVQIYIYICMKYIINESQIRLIQEGLNFDVVYSTTQPQIFRDTCMKFAKGDEDLAKEFCQIGFIKVFNNLEKYSGVGNLTGWVRRVVKNEIINELRKRKIDTSSEFDFERNDFEDKPEEEEILTSTIGKMNLLRAINNLPEGYKSVLSLYFFSHLSHKKIGEILGIDEGTSRSQLSKAKNALKKSLQKYFNRQEP